MRIRQFLAAAALLGAFPAFAQTDSGEQDPPKKIREIYAPYTEMTLDGAVLVGEKKVPVGATIVLRSGEAFPSMIEERAHFKRDLVRSIGVSVKKSVKETEITP